MQSNIMLDNRSRRHNSDVVKEGSRTRTRTCGLRWSENKDNDLSSRTKTRTSKLVLEDKDFP